MYSKVLKSSEVIFDKNKKKYIKVTTGDGNRNPSNQSDTKSKENVDEFMEAYSLDMMELAQKKYDEIVEDAVNKGEKILKEAYDEGYKNGYDEGNLKVNIEIESIIEENKQINDKIKEEYDNIYKNSEKKLMKLVLEVSKKIIDKEFEENDEAIINLIRSTYGLVEREESLTIVLSENDYEKIKERGELLKEIFGEVRYTIKKQSCVSNGTCKIETQSGIIDGSLEQKFSYLQQEILNILSN